MVKGSIWGGANIPSLRKIQRSLKKDKIGSGCPLEYVIPLPSWYGARAIRRFFFVTERTIVSGRTMPLCPFPLQDQAGLVKSLVLCTVRPCFFFYTYLFIPFENYDGLQGNTEPAADQI